MTIRKGLGPAEIRDAQQILGAFGYYHGPIDGQNSSQFATALAKYQQKVMGAAWRVRNKLGVLDQGTHGNLVSHYAHAGASYDNPPTFHPPTDEEMDEAREHLLRTEKLLEDG